MYHQPFTFVFLLLSFVFCINNAGYIQIDIKMLIYNKVRLGFIGSRLCWQVFAGWVVITFLQCLSVF